MSDKDFAAGLGCVYMIGFIIYGCFQFYAGYLGIEHYAGTGWAVAAILIALFLRFTLPVTVGSFLGAMTVWGWPWYGAAAFAVPGLAAMLLFGPLMALFSGKKEY